MTYTKFIESLKEELRKLYLQEPEDIDSGKAVRIIDASCVRITSKVFEYIDANRGKV